MRMIRCALALLCCVVSLGCAARHNPVLATLASEDQDSRRGKTSAHTDEERLKLVLAELARGAVRSPADKVNAAIVLQHTGFTFCGEKLVSRSADNYLLAHLLAKDAFEAGHADARFLVAQTIDRYLSLTQGVQKYGTNRFNDPVTGAEEWAPIDRTVTDAERARYGVPPLAELLRQFPERRSPAAPRSP
jgi:hypothetical protein